MRTRTHTARQSRRSIPGGGVPADCVLDLAKRLEMHTIPDNPGYVYIVDRSSFYCSRLQKQNLLVEVVPSPQLAVHIHQPRRCLRGCRPRVTRTPSRVSVQATARSNTRALRRRPPGLTRAESVCSRQMGRVLYSVFCNMFVR